MTDIQRYDSAFEEDVDKVANGKYVLYSQYLFNIAAEREARDRLWCEALIGTGDTELIERITKRFNTIRPDKERGQ